MKIILVIIDKKILFSYNYIFIYSIMKGTSQNVKIYKKKTEYLIKKTEYYIFY